MYLGIEIGGTKLQLAIGRGDGQLAERWRARVDPAAGAQGILAQIERGAAELLSRHMVEAIGVGFGGPVDDATRTVVKSHQIDGWEGFPLADWLTARLHVAAAVGNDADVAGLGEALHGAGKGISPLFYITVGSGIGGGLILDERIYRGFGLGAAEVGHLRIHGPDGIAPLEKISSGWGIEERYRRSAASESPRTVAEIAAARDVDPHARQVLDSAWDALAEAICHVMVLVAPRRIIIGGGVSLLGPVLFDPLRRLVAERVFRPYAGGYDIVPATLGEDVVLHGALALARQTGQDSITR